MQVLCIVYISVLCISFVEVILKVPNFLVYDVSYFVLLFVLNPLAYNKLTCENLFCE
jgi:hypothetical protein